MKNWTNLLFTLLFCIVCIQGTSAQNGLELRYLSENGLTLGVDDNRFTRLDFKMDQFYFGFSNTVFPSPIKKQFVDLSMGYQLELGSLSLFPTISSSSNLRTDDVNIMTLYLELPLVYKTEKLMLLAKPGYDKLNDLFFSALISYRFTPELHVYFSGGEEQNFTFSEKVFSFGIMRFGKRLNIKSGLQMPMDEDRFFVRLLTSFNYKLSSQKEE